MRLASFNILHGRSLTDGVVDTDRLAAAVRDLDADVLALQEVDRDQPRSDGADLTAVAAEAMGAVDHRFVATLVGTPGGRWSAATGSEPPGTAAYGIALLSRFPVLRWHVVALPRIPLRMPVLVPGVTGLTILKEEPRAAVVGTLATPIGDLTVAITHLSFVPGWNRRQLGRLRAELAAFPEPVVIMGDLNMVAPRLRHYRALATARTFPAGQPRLQLDHVLARGELPPTVAARSVHTAVSDHRALVVDLTESGGPAGAGTADDTMR